MIGFCLQFYAEVAEADSWMSDKRPLLVSRDFGKDEDSVQVTESSH